MKTRIFTPHSNSQQSIGYTSKDNIVISFPDELIPPGIHVMNGPTSMIYEDTGEVVKHQAVVDYNRNTKVILAQTRKLPIRFIKEMDTEKILKKAFNEILALGYTHFYWFSTSLCMLDDFIYTAEPRIIVRGAKIPKVQPLLNSSILL